MSDRITYAKSGHTPGAWSQLEVADLASGEILTRVVEVDTVAGVLRRVKVDEAGVVVLDAATGKPVIERLLGGFDIRAKS